MSIDSTSPPPTLPLFSGIIGLFAVIAGLINYKAGGAISAISKVQAGGTIAPKTLWEPTLIADSATFVHIINYAGWVVIALSFGLVIGAAIKAFLPQAWLINSFTAGGIKGQLMAALLGAPLMLCSCCATPVFEGVYSRTKRLGPSLAMLLAPPGLNPGALILTFLLFPGPIGIARLLGSLLLVLIGTSIVDRRYSPSVALSPSVFEEQPQNWGGSIRAFFTALKTVSINSLPAIVLGIILSAWLITSAPVGAFADTLSGPSLMIVVTLVALLIAIPTFAEIPIGLAMLQLGVPHGVIVAVLIAAPIINLPSLLGLAKLASPKVSFATAVVVFIGATMSGLALDFLVA